MDNLTVKANLPSKGRWTIPAPTYCVQDQDGNLALVSAWSTVEAVAKGRRILTEGLSAARKTATAPKAPLNVWCQA